jgi:hypothetical protein
MKKASNKKWTTSVSELSKKSHCNSSKSCPINLQRFFKVKSRKRKAFQEGKKMIQETTRTQPSQVKTSGKKVGKVWMKESCSGNFVSQDVISSCGPCSFMRLLWAMFQKQEKSLRIDSIL